MLVKMLMAAILAWVLVLGVFLIGSSTMWVSVLGGGLVGFFGGFVAYGSLSN